MNVDEKYALNWSSYTDHIKLAFTKILEADDFVDVTLSCEGKKIKAHRVILSACSAYFYDILKDNPCSHPTIVLRDMQYSNIKNILKFMYCGEVQVPTENFSSFLQTAEILQVSGLTGNEDSTEEPKNNKDQTDKAPAVEKAVSPASPQSPDIVNKRKISEPDTITNNKKTKNANRSESDEELSGSESKEDNEVNDTMKLMSVDNVPNIEKLLNDSSFLSKDTNPECECPVCGEKFMSIYMLKQHVPYHLGETKCSVCGKILSRLDLLKKHLLQVHKIFTNPGKKDR